MASRRTLHSRVKKGLALVLEQKPRKARRVLKEAVAAGRFSISSSCGCVLGHVYGDYHSGLEESGLVPKGSRYSNAAAEKAIKRGFLWEDQLDVPVLNELWREEIAAL